MCVGFDSRSTVFDVANRLERRKSADELYLFRKNFRQIFYDE